MGLPAYIYSNTPFENGTLTSSTANSSFPLANLKDRIKANPFKFSASNGGWIEVDFGGNVTFDSIAILGHNMTAATFSDLNINAGASPNPGAQISDPAFRLEDIYAPVTPVSARYVRWTFTTSSGVVSVGEIVIESRVTMPRAARWGIVPGKEARGVTHRTYGGATWDYEFYTMRSIRPTFRFPESELASFELFSDRVGREPFVWIPDVDAAPVYYVKKQRGFNPTPLGAFRDSSSMAVWYDWTVELEAESIGLVINS